MLAQFLHLSRRRIQAFGSIPNPVQLTEIEAHWRIHTLDECISLEEFAHWMNELDDAYLDYYIQREEKRKHTKQP